MQAEESHRGGKIQLVGKGRFKQTVQVGHSKKVKIHLGRFSVEAMKKLQVSFNLSDKTLL